MAPHEPDESVDGHLRAVFDELVTTIYVTKQLVWSTPGSRRDQLREVLGFVVEQSHLVDEAVARLDAGATAMAAPSSHPRRNLLGEVSNDVQAALALYVERVTDIATRIDRRSADMGGAPEAQLLADLAEGLRRRVSHLVEP